MLINIPEMTLVKDAPPIVYNNVSSLPNAEDMLMESINSLSRDLRLYIVSKIKAAAQNGFSYVGFDSSDPKFDRVHEDRILTINAWLTNLGYECLYKITADSDGIGYADYLYVYWDRNGGIDREQQ